MRECSVKADDDRSAKLESESKAKSKIFLLKCSLMLKLIDTWCEVYVNKFQLLLNTARIFVSGREGKNEGFWMKYKHILNFENNYLITEM